MWTASGFDLPLRMITYFISTQRPLMQGVDHFECLAELLYLVVVVNYYGWRPPSKFFFFFFRRNNP